MTIKSFQKNPHCLPMFLESSSKMSFKSSIDKEPSITEERLLTTSYNTVGKSPDVFWREDEII
jgi:hypothetical protein